MLEPTWKLEFAEDGLISQRLGAGFKVTGQRLIEIVFRKQIGLDHVQSDNEGQVLNRYRVMLKRQFTKAEIALVAAKLFKDDYGHSFMEDEGVYWTLE